MEYAIVARREGMSRFEALVDACHKRSRPPAVFTYIDDAQRVIGAVAARLGLGGGMRRLGARRSPGPMCW